jgi:hypothetical protein
MTPRKQVHKPSTFAALVGRALRRSARKPRQTARMHGTPIYVWKDGKIIAEKPGPRSDMAQRITQPQLESYP